MALIRCKYCGLRIRPTQEKLHLKHCRVYRQKLKRGEVKPLDKIVIQAEAKKKETKVKSKQTVAPKKIVKKSTRRSTKKIS